MQPDELEYILSKKRPVFESRKFQVISKEEALELYFRRGNSTSRIYVVNGGQKGDEGKGKITEVIFQTDPTIKWALAANSTHNAGKGVHTHTLEGEPVRISLHLCPATLPDENIKNYIGRNTQVNLFTLEREILSMQEATHRTQLGVHYHLMVDQQANLVTPFNRADDVVGKENAMGSTIAGATLSLENVVGKKAPLLEEVLYDSDRFDSLVRKQQIAFEDRLSHDSKFKELGIIDSKTLGDALNDKEKTASNDRLKALKGKLSTSEIEFFSHANPAQFLREQYTRIIDSQLFNIGEVNKEIDAHLERGEPGIIEGVQSTPLSGRVKYSKNRTAASTDSFGTIGDAAIHRDDVPYNRISVFKFANTSVGGNKKTMSGFIRQDQLSRLGAISPMTKPYISFEKTASLDHFLEPEQIAEAFQVVTAQFDDAIKNGYSLDHSKVQIEGIDCEFSLAEARALLTAYVFGETGETSKRARICRYDDRVEREVVYTTDGNTLQFYNAVDRALQLQNVGIVLEYETTRPYRELDEGTRIIPGMSLLMEHKTVEACIPVITHLPSWPTLNENDTNELRPGEVLHPNLADYLSLMATDSMGKMHDVIGIGHGKKPSDVSYVKAV